MLFCCQLWFKVFYFNLNRSIGCKVINSEANGQLQPDRSVLITDNWIINILLSSDFDLLDINHIFALFDVFIFYFPQTWYKYCSVCFFFKCFVTK